MHVVVGDDERQRIHYEQSEQVVNIDNDEDVRYENQDFECGADEVPDFELENCVVSLVKSSRYLSRFDHQQEALSSNERVSKNDCKYVSDAHS